ncbi:hypothetical protein Y695_02639 [Hydrogenophaga sp. T4]|nr:hypothetical protein Y695_02639 [Hydrogenophaga sp. T4]
MGQDEGLHHRVDHVAPAPATEDAVVTRTFGFIVHLVRLGNAGAQVVGGGRLARAGDVVELAFDREQAGGLDVLWANALDLALHGFHVPGAVDQLEVLEHRLDGFQVVVGVHVEHRVVLVVELAVVFGALVVALDQVFEIVVVAGGMAVGVHGHETGVLQEAGVDTAASARKAARHAVDHVVFEPAVAALGRQIVDGRGRLAGVDGAAHHGHGQRRHFAAAGHQRNSGQHRNGGLAHAHDVAVAVTLLQVLDELLNVVT